MNAREKGMNVRTGGEMAGSVLSFDVGIVNLNACLATMEDGVMTIWRHETICIGKRKTTQADLVRNLVYELRNRSCFTWWQPEHACGRMVVIEHQFVPFRPGTSPSIKLPVIQYALMSLYLGLVDDAGQVIVAHSSKKMESEPVRLLLPLIEEEDLKKRSILLFDRLVQDGTIVLKDDAALTAKKRDDYCDSALQALWALTQENLAAS